MCSFILYRLLFMLTLFVPVYTLPTTTNYTYCTYCPGFRSVAVLARWLLCFDLLLWHLVIQLCILFIFTSVLNFHKVCVYVCVFSNAVLVAHHGLPLLLCRFGKPLSPAIHKYSISEKATVTYSFCPGKQNSEGHNNGEEGLRKQKMGLNYS